jgi:hypothetical protein
VQSPPPATPAHDQCGGKGRRTPHPWRDQLLGDAARIGADDLRAASKLGLRDRGRHGIGVHCHHPETCSSKPHGVEADAAADVDHVANPACRNRFAW